jgi:hypothetical protein
MRELGLAAAAMLVAAACDLPSDLPRGWDTEFQIEATRSTLPVTQLLPTGISMGTDRASFTLALAPVTFDLSLATLCSACPGVHGQTVPKPAFDSTLTRAVPLPSDVASTTLAAGRADVTLTNQLGFDPLRPGAGARGSLTLKLKSGNTVLGMPVVIDGSASAFPPGGSVTRPFDLTGVTVTDPLTVELRLDSPVGDPVTVNTSGRLVVAVSGSQLAVASANVRVTGKQVVSGESVFDLRDMDGYVRDHLKRGSLLITVVNPFDVTGTLTLRVGSPTATIFKPVALSAGTQQSEVEFTPDEVRRLVGSELAVSVQGAVWGPAAGVLVTPRQVLSIDAVLRVTLGPLDR